MPTSGDKAGPDDAAFMYVTICVLGYFSRCVLIVIILNQ